MGVLNELDDLTGGNQVEAPGESSFKRGLRSGWMSAKGQVNSLAGGVAQQLGADQFANDRFAAAHDLERQAQESAPRISRYQDVKGLGDAYDYVSGLVGSSIPVSAAALGGAVASRFLPGAATGLRSAFGATAATAPMEIGEAVQRQQAADPNKPIDLGSAALTGTVSAGMQSVVPAMVAGKVAGPTIRGVEREALLPTIAKNFAADVPLEAATEAAGTRVHQLGASAFNPNRDTSGDVDELKQAAVGGAAAGAGFGTVGAAADVAHAAAARGSAKPAKPAEPGTAAPEATAEPGGIEKIAGIASGAAERTKAAATDLFKSFGPARSEGAADADVMERGGDLLNPAELTGVAPEAVELKLRQSDESLARRAGQFAQDLMARADLSQETRDQINKAASDLTDKAGRAFIAAQQKAAWARDEGAKLVDQLYETYAPKKSRVGDDELPAVAQGLRNALVEHVVPVVEERFPGLMADADRINRLAEVLRGAVSGAMQGKPIDPTARGYLRSLLGDANTAKVLRSMYEATGLSTTPETDAKFFEELDAIDSAERDSSSMRDFVMKSIDPKMQDKVRTTDVDNAIENIRAFVANKGAAFRSPAEATYYEKQFRSQLETYFGENADKVLAKFSAAEPRQHMVASVGEESARESEGELEDGYENYGVDKLGERSTDNQYFGSERNGSRKGLKFMDSERVARALYPGSEPAILSRKFELEAQFPNRSVEEITGAQYAEETGAEVAEGDKKRVALVVRGEESGERINEDTFRRLKADARYQESPSRIPVTEKLVLDAHQLVKLGEKRLKERKEQLSNDARARKAQAFAEGVAAAQDFVGRAFEVPADTVVYLSNSRPVTYGQLKRVANKPGSFVSKGDFDGTSDRMESDREVGEDERARRAEERDFQDALTAEGRTETSPDEEIHFAERGAKGDLQRSVDASGLPFRHSAPKDAFSYRVQKNEDGKPTRVPTALTENGRRVLDSRGQKLEQSVSQQQRNMGKALRWLATQDLKVGDALGLYAATAPVSEKAPQNVMDAADKNRRTTILKLTQDYGGAKEIQFEGKKGTQPKAKAEQKPAVEGPKSTGPIHESVRKLTDEQLVELINSNGDREQHNAAVEEYASRVRKGATKKAAPEVAAEAKKSELVHRARSGDPKLIAQINGHTDVKALQRAADHMNEWLDNTEGLSDQDIDNAARTIDAFNRRVTQLIGSDPDLAYAATTRKYSLVSNVVHEKLGRQGIAAAHDSPHRFDGKFDWRAHKGKGEGIAKFGAGTYLSTGDATHRFYKEQFAAQVTPNSGYKGDSSPTYHVTIDATPEEILDWNAELSEQNPFVRAALVAAARAEGVELQPDMTGAEVYDAFAAKYAGQDREGVYSRTSDLLQSHGLVGHIYHASGGRDADERNYVIYDDSRIGTNWVQFSQQSASQGVRMSPQMRQDAKKYIDTVLAGKIKTQFGNMQYAGEFLGGAGVEGVVRLSVFSLDPKGTAYHEALHAFIHQLRSRNMNSAVNELLRAATTENVQKQLRELLKNEPAALQQLSDPEERAAYMYQFYVGGRLTLKEKKAAGVIEALKNLVRNVLGMWANEQNAQRIMDYFHSGEYAANFYDRNALARAIEGPARNAALKAVGDATKTLTELAERVASMGHNRLRETNVPALVEIADKVKRLQTQEGEDNGFLPAARIARTEWLNKFGDLVKDLSPEEIKETLKALQLGDPKLASTANARIAARLIRRNVLDRFYEYLTGAGVQLGDMGYKKDYFPRVWDPVNISKNLQSFEKMLDKYVAAGHLSEDAKSQVINTLTSGSGSELQLVVDRPGMLNAKQRALWFVDAADAEPFVKKDLFSIIDGYIAQGTRRAEWARRFGDDNLGFEALLKDAKKQGATDDQISTARDYIRGVNGTLGDSIDPRVRRIMGDMVVYQNIRLLPLAIFSSVVDPMGILVRGGTANEAWNAFRRGIREIPQGFKKNPERDESYELAELMGTIENSMLTSTLGQLYSQGMVGTLGQKINDKFFKYNLMEQFNLSMRVGATEAAMNFIARHASRPSDHSERWLRELGLDPASVPLMNGELVYKKADLVALGMSEDDALQMENKLRSAVNMWVDGAVLRPDAADRPIWFNDPRWMLITHLKQFTYSFHQTILGRVMHEFEQGNYKPAMALASYVPIMIGADFVKAMIQGGGELPDWKKAWTAGDFVWSGVQRAGLLGVTQFSIDGYGAIVGPTVEQLTDVLRVADGRKRTGSLVIDAMPANGLYKYWLDDLGNPEPAHDR